MNKMKWDFRHEEEVYDDWGTNLAGVITNGEDFLFYHFVPKEKDGDIFCHIYNSIWMDDSTEECCYLWTSENDEILINALNNAEKGDYCGDDSILHQIEFKKVSDDYPDYPDRYPDEIELEAESNRAEEEYLNR